MRTQSLSILLLFAAACVAAPTEKDSVLFKTFNDVKSALLSGQHLSAWVEFAGCKVLAEKPLEISTSRVGNLLGDSLVQDDGGAMPAILTWTQKFHTWQWMSKIDNQEVFWFPSSQALGEGRFAEERVLLWQNGTLYLEVIAWGSGMGKNATEMVLNCTLGTSALFQGWNDMKKPIDTPAHAVAASGMQGVELSTVIMYDECTKDKPSDGAPPMVMTMSGQAHSDGLTGTDEKGEPFYMGSFSFMERSMDDHVRAFGDDIAILNNGTVLVDSFCDFFMGDEKVMHRDYLACCEFGKSILVFA